jgi:hypothetical protein
VRTIKIDDGFSDLAEQRYIQKPASLPEFFILESSLKDCMTGS